MCNFPPLLLVALFLLIVPGSRAQSEESSCYGPGSIATTVIVTIIVTILLLFVLYLIWKRYWIKRKGKHLVLETDPEKGKEEYAYDNAAFGEVTATPLEKSTEKNGKVDSSKSKWSQWSPLGVLIAKNEKQKTLDDSALQVGEIKTVSLKSHDFTGLGFNIYGNMRDGIFIKDILHRGPASESGKLNSGDRIKSVTINFEHVVYEDALTILSYASPYEVILEAQGGKIGTINQMHTKTAQLGHPLYRSSSTTDLIQIRKKTKKRLFPPDDGSTVSSPYSSLQKTRVSNAPTLERNRSGSPKPENTSKNTKTQSPQQLKTQLEQKIFQNHKQQLKTKDERPRQEQELALQKTENKYQKFGIKVLPVDLKTDQPREQTSPKSAELSQNDNNINLERHLDKFKVVPTIADAIKIEEDSGIDEVDKLGRKPVAPPIKKREKSATRNDEDSNVVQTVSVTEDEVGKTETFIRNGPNGSGIKRDKDGIPQEIPSHMLNAAVAARRNRKASVENAIAAEDIKSPKKPKGRAPAPPDDKIKISNAPIESDQDSVPKSDSFDEIRSSAEDAHPQKPESASISEGESKKESADYASDSDGETDNLSSVNTIELNASDITIHQTEDNEEIQNRRTASTGDLTKIQKTRKTSTGTLERAQSLDITDTAMPPLNKKRKGGSIEENLDSKSGSDESLYGKAKEPRLSLALDGLNTFQRSRLKKSTEWGNLEDAIVNLDKDQSNQEVLEKIDRTKKPDTNVIHVKDVQKATGDSLLLNKVAFEQNLLVESRSQSFQLGEPTTAVTDEMEQSDWKKITKNSFENRNGEEHHENDQIKVDKLHSVSFVTLDAANNDKPADAVLMVTSEVPRDDSNPSISIQQEISHKQPIQSISLLPNSIRATENLLHSERRACGTDPFYNLPNKMYDTNASDDIKVSRHSLGSLETPDTFKHLNTSNGNVSNITIGEKIIDDRHKNGSSPFKTDIDKKSFAVKQENDEELYTTALDTTLINDTFIDTPSSVSFEKVSVTSPNLLKNNVAVTEVFRDVNDTVTVEGPTSLTLEINDNGPKSVEEAKNVHISNSTFQISTPPATTAIAPQEHSPKSNFSLTYITEIQVLTPSNEAGVTETVQSDVSIKSPDKNRKNFESNIKQFESNIQTANSVKNLPVIEKVDPQKELQKIREIVEEQLKKLPEMRFSTSSYETPKSPENCSSSQIDQLRSNFEKSPLKTPPKGEGSAKSRIPVATAKTPPTSPERRDSRNFDLEVDKEIVAIMSSPVHSTPIKYQPKTASKNVSITSIRSSSKIPSGFPNRPPVPPRRYESSDSEGANRSSTNGNIDSSFKQWVFNPNDAITNVTVTENKSEHK